MTIAYDPEQTKLEALAKVITDLGYEAEVVESPAAKEPSSEQAPLLAPIPQGAPEFFVAAFDEARKHDRPLIIDFWATWCAPCIQLKKVTMADPGVAAALEGVEVVFVDLDAHPGLAKTYGVKSIPDVFFVNHRGYIVDRLRSFEEPAPFLARVQRMKSSRVGEATAMLGVETRVPTDELAKELELPFRVRRQGRQVTRVAPDGAAAAAGIRQNDVLLRIGDVDLYSQDDIDDVLRVSRPGQAVSIVLRRSGEGEPRTLEVRLAASAPRLRPHFDWQYASLGQLPQALEQARTQEKKVLVGLSGAET